MDTKEFKQLLSSYLPKGIVFGKLENYILERINATKEEVISELSSLDNLEFVQKQERKGETRYVLFVVYSKKRGRVYILNFRDDNIRIVTAYPLGRKTLSKYSKRRFISLGGS